MKTSKHFAIVGWAWLFFCCAAFIFIAQSTAEMKPWLLPMSIGLTAVAIRLAQLEFRYRNTLESGTAINFLLPRKISGRYWWTVVLRGILTALLVPTSLVGIGLLAGASWQGVIFAAICTGSVILLRKDPAMSLNGPQEYQDQLIITRIVEELHILPSDLDEERIDSLHTLQSKRYRVFALHDIAQRNNPVLPRLIQEMENEEVKDSLYRLFGYGIMFSRAGWSLVETLDHIESFFPREKPKSLPEVFQVIVYAYLATTENKDPWPLLPGLAKLVSKGELEGLPTPEQCVSVLEKCLEHHVEITERHFTFPGLFTMKPRQIAKGLIACAK